MKKQKRLAIKLYKWLVPMMIKQIRLFTTNWKFRHLEELKPEHLTELGFEFKKIELETGTIRNYYVHPDIKNRDSVWFEFESGCYRVRHGNDRTFIALETSKHWAMAYLSLVWGDETFDYLT